MRHLPDDRDALLAIAEFLSGPVREGLAENRALAYRALVAANVVRMTAEGLAQPRDYEALAALLGEEAPQVIDEQDVDRWSAELARRIRENELGDMAHARRVVMRLLERELAVVAPDFRTAGEDV